MIPEIILSEKDARRAAIALVHAFIVRRHHDYQYEMLIGVAEMFAEDLEVLGKILGKIKPVDDYEDEYFLCAKVLNREVDPGVLLKEISADVSPILTYSEQYSIIKNALTKKI